MSEDYWTAFRQREAQLRQERTVKSQHLSELQEYKRKESERQQSLREQSRIESEQRLSEERRIAERQANDKRRIEEEKRTALLVQAAKELRIANQRAQEAHRIATQKLQEEARVKEKGSPIEASFWATWCELCPSIELKRQYQIENRRVDFAHLETMTAVELDGHEFHSKRGDRTRDYQRQRQIEDQGWFFVRFTGSEVYHDVEGCVHVLWNRIQGRMAR